MPTLRLAVNIQQTLQSPSPLAHPKGIKERVGVRGCNRPVFTMNIRQTLWHASQQLADLTDSPQLDAEILLAHVLQKSRTYLFTWPEQDIDTPSQQQFAQLI